MTPDLSYKLEGERRRCAKIMNGMREKKQKKKRYCDHGLRGIVEMSQINNNNILRAILIVQLLVQIFDVFFAQLFNLPYFPE